MRLDVTGAHQHHQLDHLIHLVAHLEQVELGDATSIEELPRGDWWIFSPSYYDRIHRMNVKPVLLDFQKTHKGVLQYH